MPYSPETKQRAVAMHDDGMTYTAIAEVIGASIKSVSNWCNPDRYERDKRQARSKEAAERAERIAGRTCDECGSRIDEDVKAGSRYCTYECSRRCNARNTQALKRGAPRETFVHLGIQQIIDEHGDDCHVCGEHIDRDVEWPDALSMEVDHLIRTRDGGPNTLDNVRLAHLRCNRARG